MEYQENKKEKKINGFDKWEVERFVCTLKEAAEIENNEDKMKAVKEMMPEYLKKEEKEAKAEIKSIAELRQKYNDLDKE